MSHAPTRKAKRTNPTREEILKGVDWEPLDLPGCPTEVVEAESRRMQDYIVGWVQGLSAHIEKCEVKPQRKRAKSSASRTGAKKRPRGGRQRK
jgi:hypothetical protein